MLTVILSLSACTDSPIADAIPSGGGAGTKTMTITSKNWPFTSWGNSNIRPGDDFYAYALGAWYKSASYNQGLTMEGMWEINQYFNLVTYTSNALPSLQKLLADTLHVDDSACRQAANAYTQEWIKRVDAANTREELGAVMGQLLNVGYQIGLTAKPYNLSGKLSMVITSSSNGEDTSSMDMRTSPLLDTRYTNTLKFAFPTRATGDELSELIGAIAVCWSLRNPLIYLVDDNDLMAYCQRPLSEIKEELKQRIAAHDAKYASREGLQQTGRNYQYYISLMYQQYMNYEVAYYLYNEKNFYNKERQERVKTMCEELRTALDARLASSEWMSETAKTKARAKAKEMKFLVAYPDIWYKDGLASLKGNSLVEDTHLLYEAYFRISKYICGMNVQDAVQYIFPQWQNIATVNAFYSPNYNTFFLYPIFIASPFYRDDVLDAYSYALIGSVIAHEMTHGFDTDGVLYDEYGVATSTQSNPYGWWTQSDYNAFVLRCLKLIDSYNKIPFEPYTLPGYQSNGARCLDDNIADVGGICIAFDSYTRHLKQEGYDNESITQLQRLFLTSFAYAWRTKSSPTYLQNLYRTDEHSSYYARVIGSLQHLDEWYDLFDVTSDQTYYLPREKRCHLY